MKHIKMLMILLVSLGFLAGCGSSSKSTVTYDSGVASGSGTLDDTKDVTIVAYDEKSNRELASTTIKAGTLLLDATGNPIAEEVEYDLNVTSVSVDDSTLETTVTMKTRTASGGEVEEISEDLVVNVVPPRLEGMSDLKPTSAVLVAEDAATATALRGGEIVLTINPDGSVDVTVTYKPGRKWKIRFVFPVTTGATGAN
ncbi:MAG: hypothetical protein U9N52_01970 [Campylobacterota bacterium]|nr:hypothetical protein [Campylobacterota bacterium]